MKLIGALCLFACGCGGLIADDATALGSPDGGRDARPPITTPTATATTSPSGHPNPGASSSPPSVCGNVSGSWSGTWATGSGLSGTWQTDWVEHPDGTITGNESVSGTSCGASAVVEGRRSGCSISFGLAKFGSCSVEFVGTVSGNAMSGTFAVTAGIQDQGTWAGKRLR